MNPTRTGIYKMLEAMGADLTYSNERVVGGEPVADITARHSALKGIEVPPDVAPSMIDEFPGLFRGRQHGAGPHTTSGLDELRVKESDRLALMATGLAAIGATVEEREDGLVIDGTGGEPLEGGATIASALDHRIAMSFAVAGQHCYHTQSPSTMCHRLRPAFRLLRRCWRDLLAHDHRSRRPHRLGQGHHLESSCGALWSAFGSTPDCSIARSGGR
jgi:5-enolpyruvylshikimate-3-phosphate synthase